MYYRIGDKVRIEKGKTDLPIDGLIGTIKHIASPRKGGYVWGYGVKLDITLENGSNRVLFATIDPRKKHGRLTKIDSSELLPKFLNYKKFKFK